MLQHSLKTHTFNMSITTIKDWANSCTYLIEVFLKALLILDFFIAVAGRNKHRGFMGLDWLDLSTRNIVSKNLK